MNNEKKKCDCFEVLREREGIQPFPDADDLAVINATALILEKADDSELEDIFYLIEDELLARDVFSEDVDDEQCGCE